MRVVTDLFCKEADMDVNLDRQPKPRGTSPPLVQETREQELMACPFCGESRQVQLVWLDVDRVRCKSCSRHFYAWLNRDD